MGAELDLAEDEAIAVFSARKIRTRLRADGLKPVAAFRDTLSWGRERLYGLFHDGQPAESLVRARAHIVDEVLREAWLRVLPEAPTGVTLVRRRLRTRRAAAAFGHRHPAAALARRA